MKPRRIDYRLVLHRPVELPHAFLVIKRIFGWSKVRYRGLTKNTHWLYISCGLANLYVVPRRLLAGV